MNQDWSDMADCLRGEIAEYGRLLNLIEDQQKLIFARNPDAIVRLNPALEAQVDVLHECRARREEATRIFSAARALTEVPTLRALVPLVSADARPLLLALIAEVNHLVRRVKRAMAVNLRLLSCTVEYQQEFMRRLWPAAFTKTYAADGRVSVARLGRSPSMQTAG
jgi:hypothetical protein